MTHIATITSKRQLTIPIDLFNRFGLRSGQKVTIAQVDDRLVIEPMLTIVESLAGSIAIPKRFQGLKVDQIIQRAKIEHFTKQ